ncbi:MAG: hypothetical protein GEV07_30125 [Streptosporangiales bacterium]|nr:hypothetical protein [Streptosporangiales bacterium]
MIPLHRDSEKDQREDQGQDRPAPAPVGESGERSPIIPGFLRRDQLWITVRSMLVLTGYRVRFHAVRVPVYVARTGWYALRGTVDLTNAVLRWWHWTNGWTLESLAVAAGRSGHHDAMNAHREGKRTRGTRGRILAVAAVAALAALVASAVWLPGWVWPPLGLAAVVALARRGRPDGR